jgi:dephospho-CoA kinase
VSRWENKYVIGLTGNIAVGKSVVRQMLQHLGAYPIDADALTHQAMLPGSPGYQPVIEMFGRFMVDSEGQIDRARLGALAFAVPAAMTTLEKIIHPVVGQAIQALIARAKQPVIVVEAIKLLESDLAGMVDAVWVVDAPPETQYRRLLEKRKMSPEEAKKRILAQGAQADKINRADVIIRNNDNVEETWKQVQIAWNELRRAAGTQSDVKRTTGTMAAIPRQPEAVPAAAASQPQAQPQDMNLFDPKTQLIIRRGMPGNAEAIANFITQVTRKEIGRMDIMLAFGQKSYHLAYGKNDQVIALIGWTVENLITRVDEFYISPGVPLNEVIRDLIIAIEDASRELQSEVSFIALPQSTSQDLVQSFLKNGYQLLKLNEVKFPAWREAASEMVAQNNTLALMKQLRADRVMKPI